MSECGATAELVCGLVPGKQLQAMLANAVNQRRLDRSLIWRWVRAAGELDCAQATAPGGCHGSRGWIELNVVANFGPVGEKVEHRFLADRGTRKDPRARRTTSDFAHRKPVAASQR